MSTSPRCITGEFQSNCMNTVNDVDDNGQSKGPRELEHSGEKTGWVEGGGGEVIGGQEIVSDQGSGWVSVTFTR